MQDKEKKTIYEPPVKCVEVNPLCRERAVAHAIWDWGTLSSSRFLGGIL
jgi:hypothetical protein